MKQTFERVREPLAVIVILLSLSMMAFHFVRFVIELPAGRKELGLAALEVGPRLMNIGWLLIIVVTSLFCLLTAPPSRHAAAVGMLASAVLGLAVIVGVGMFVTGITLSKVPLVAGFLGFIGAGLDLGLKGVGAFFLWRLSRSAVKQSKIPPKVTAETAPTQLAVDEVTAGIQPVWDPEEAIGAQWQRAGDAASGAQANAFGSSTGPRWQAGEATQANWSVIEGRGTVDRDGENPRQAGGDSKAQGN